MIDSISQNVELNDGTTMPGFGFGCYKAEGVELQKAVLAAAEVGYKMLDTASYYKNEQIIGATLKKLPHKMYVISKIWPCDFGKPVAALDRSLKELGLERLDAYLLHWPGLNRKLRLKAYEALLREQEKGKIGALGVSNFSEDHLQELQREFGFWPPINQIECHPFFAQESLCSFCAKNKIQVMAWSPLGRAHDMADPAIIMLAEEYDVSPAQIILRWHIQNDIVPIPKSVHPERIRQNAEIFAFDLSQTQMDIIDALSKPDGRRGPDPANFPDC